MMYVPKAVAARKLGITKNRVEDLIREGVLSTEKGGIAEEEIQMLESDRTTYFSFLEYAIEKSNGRFHGKLSTDRDKLLDVLEENDFFGLDHWDWQELLLGCPRDGVFFLRRDRDELDRRTQEFFESYKIDFKTQVRNVIDQTEGRLHTKESLVQFMLEVSTESAITASFCEFAKALLAAPDLYELSDESVLEIANRLTTRQAKQYLIKFLQYAKGRNRSAILPYGIITLKKPVKKAAPSYSDATYLEIGKCVFNSDYIRENNLVAQALDVSLYAEMWLYVALHYVLPWRSEDICSRWRYLGLTQEKAAHLGLDFVKLEEDLRQEKISDETYKKVCEYALAAIQASESLPEKIGALDPLPLKALITPELMSFFGRLLLVCEIHHLKDEKKGYMRPERRASYQNRINLKRFFGQSFFDALGGRNLQSRRLNKAYLQGVEEAARETGCGAILASAVASYARNHKDLGSIQSYLNDHNLSGESAEFVLYTMLERGTFGFGLYNAILTAYPESFLHLSLTKQTQIMSLATETTPLKMEERASGALASKDLCDSFLKGQNKTSESILAAMFEISQLRGRAKDEGIGCLLRAQKQACIHPRYESCIKNGCPHLVFMQLGFLPLVRILSEYVAKVKTGDKKAESVLRNVLLPRFQNIISFIMETHQADRETRVELKHLMETELKNGV